MADEVIQIANKHFPGGRTVAYLISVGNGIYRVSVIHRFDSGNFLTEKPIEDCSLVAAKGLLHFYTS